MIGTDNHPSPYRCRNVKSQFDQETRIFDRTSLILALMTRIVAQINPDGHQPGETWRTKSFHYSSINLWAFVNLTFMGRKVVGDLWEFETDDGRSLRQAYRFLEPSAL